jgi:hypothetical protein
MNKIRLITALAALSLIGAPAIAVAPAATAATSVTVSAAPAVTMAAHAAAITASVARAHHARPAFTTTCISQNVQFVVNADNIHIRNAPNGLDIFNISRTAFFDSFPLCYSSNVAGQHWVFGFSNAHTGHIGWVGCEYLTGCVALLGS